MKKQEKQTNKNSDADNSMGSYQREEWWREGSKE